ASQVVYLFEQQTHFLIQRLLGWVFLFDAALISLLIYLLGIKSDQLFITYFAVIAIAGIAKNVKASVAITVLVSAFYILVSLNEGGITMAELTTRPLFFFGTSISVSYLSEEIASQYKGRMNITRHFQSLIDNTLDYIVVIDREARILFVNRTQTGLDRDKVLGTLVFDYIAPEYYTIVRKAVNQVFESGLPASYEVSGLGPNNAPAWYDSRLSPITDDQGAIIAATVISTDVTERRKAEAELKKVQEQLFQAQKMDAMGRLVSGIAHDFNNIVQVVIGYSDLFLKDMTPGSPNYKDMKEINNAGHRAAELTGQLLSFSRRKKMELKPLNLNDAIGNMQKMLKRLIGEDIIMELDLDPLILPVKADLGQFGQVVMNLVVNARDAIHTSVSPGSGRITIKTQRVIIDDDYVKFNPGANPGDFICVSVNDTGAGMTKETVSHLFEPFFSTKKDGKGTGLGLSVVYGIVKQHQGWIHVYSEPGGGTNINVYFPVTTDVAGKSDIRTIALPATVGSPAGATGKSPGGILVVDDEKGVLSFISHGLRKQGYAVSEAATAAEALHLFKKTAGAFHLALIDIGLPDKNGFQLAEELLSQKPGAKVIFSSGYIDEKARWKVINEKNYKCLQKPFGIETLIKTINEVSRET
ncbi:MAG: ATP-binding protein, partial [Planctomycetota bacterium]